MILKDIDTKTCNTKYTKSGFACEKQMAFYLKRAFENEKNIYVINDLRLKKNNDYAQIDHLILHGYGFTIIESKSVSSKISVNKYGEWKRIFNGKENGMPSPIQQAKRQMDFLIAFLEENSIDIFRENIATKIIGKPKYKIFKQDVLVAISDSGIIERDNIDIPEALKADLIADKIFDDLVKYKKDSLIEIVNPFASITHQFHADTLKKIANLLLSLHCSIKNNSVETSVISNKPIINKKEEIQPLKETEAKNNKKISKTCSKCKSQNIQINYGKYGYYFKCLDCDGNTAIKLTCSSPTCKPKLTKRKLQFYKICKSCGIEELFYENKA